jgi:hypothetical protein
MSSPRGVTPPNLPTAPNQYERRYQDQFANALRLFFNSLTREVNSPTPHASYFDTTTQTNPAANQVNLFTYNSKVSEFKISRGSPTSKIFINETGLYNFQFSAQLDKTGGGKDSIFIWPRINGVNVPDSATKVVIQGSTDEVVAAWNFVLLMQSGDYFELAWQSADTDVVILADPPASNYPGIPSIIMTVTWVSNYQLNGST